MGAIQVLTTGDVARELGVEQWQVRRLFQDGTLPPTPRAGGGVRIITPKQVPAIRKALIKRGFLKVQEQVSE